MGLTIQYTPPFYSSIHDDLIYTVADPIKTADPSTYPNFKFIGDVYVGGVLVATIRRVPNPSTGIGVFNIGQVVRNYIATTFNPAPSVLVAQVLGDTLFNLTVTMKFGEEYNYTSYYNLVIDGARVFFNHYNNRLNASGSLFGRATGLSGAYYNSSGRVTPLILTRVDPFIDFVWPNSPGPGVSGDEFGVQWTGKVVPEFTETYTFYTYNDDGVRLYVNGTLLVDFLSNAFPTERSGTIALTAGVEYNIVLELYQYLEAAPTATMKLSWSSPSTPKAVIPQSRLLCNLSASVIANSSLVPKIDKVASNRLVRGEVLLSSSYMFVPYFPTSTDLITIDITPVGGGSTYSTSFNPANRYDMQLLNLSPGAINAIAPGTINAATTRYTVDINDQTYTFYIICEPIYQPFMIHFLNQYGGFDSKLFAKVSRRTYDITRSDFGKLKFIVDSAGVPSIKNTNGVFNETRSIYSSQFTEKMTINSDNLTDAEYVWLRDLIVSPMVYIEDGGYFFPCVIKDSNYEPKQYVNDDLTNLTLNIEFGNQLNAQYR